MSDLTKEAAAVLADAGRKISSLSDKLSANIQTEDFEKVNLAYRAAAALDVYASQMSGEVKVYEGPCEINNRLAEVVIQGFAVRDNIQFEIQVDGKWITGYRQNSQYGQVFHTRQNGVYILTSDYRGRVTAPFKMYDLAGN